MAKVGRKTEPYRTAQDEPIIGLYRFEGTNRWRITLKGEHFGKRFNESDERAAVAKFRGLTQTQTPTVNVPIQATSKFVRSTGGGTILFTKSVVTDKDFWETVREEILANPAHAARMTGITQLANLYDLPTPAAPLTFKAIGKLYEAKSESRPNTIRHVHAALNRIKAGTGETLADATTEKLLEFRDATCTSLAPSGAAAVFGAIKSALAFAVKQGLDATQLNLALGRMRVLAAPKNKNKPEPKPITPAEFYKLLEVADGHWRPMLLLGLNMAMYIEDLLTLRWDGFDLKAATFVGQRAKTQVVRVGVLWPETIKAIKALPRKAESPYVYTSSHGSRFNNAGQYNVYKKLRERAGVSAPFSSLRDAAYTIACRNCEDRISRVFAGHRMAGLMDSYIARNPAWVKPASDAVYKAFGPFTTLTA